MNTKNKFQIKRFLDCYVPVTTCNLRCKYCYITQERQFDNQLHELPKSPEFIGQALSNERLGGTCCINLCAGGETLLHPDIIEIIKVLLIQGHVVMLVTNGTISKRFDEITTLNKDLLSKLFLKFSFHYLELKRTNTLDKFFDNIQKIKNVGCSFSLELTPSDDEIPFIDEIKDICLQKVGALCHITIARDNTLSNMPILTNLPWEEYKQVWSQFDSELFDFKISVFNEKRTEFCYAGDWSGYINLATGELKQCYKGKIIDNIYKNIHTPMNFYAIGNNCQEAHCFNAHSWLIFGTIPEFKLPVYSKMRNRICKDGSEWLTPAMKKFMNSKLANANSVFSESEKILINREFKKIRNFEDFKIHFKRLIQGLIANKL